MILLLPSARDSHHHYLPKRIIIRRRIRRWGGRVERPLSFRGVCLQWITALDLIIIPPILSLTGGVGIAGVVGHFTRIWCNLARGIRSVSDPIPHGIFCAAPVIMRWPQHLPRHLIELNLHSRIHYRIITVLQLQYLPQSIILEEHNLQCSQLNRS